MSNPTFAKARPVWLAHREKELNLQAVFQCHLPAGSTCLRLTGATLYRIYINDQFVAYGPARGAHGYTRIDKIDLAPIMQTNALLSIEVAGYNCHSYYTLAGKSFLQAEIYDSVGEVLAATGLEREFRGYVMSARRQKAPRYSFQRTFGEIYEIAEGNQYMLGRQELHGMSAELSIVEHGLDLLEREVPMPTFNCIDAGKPIRCGQVFLDSEVELPVCRNIDNVGQNIDGFPKDELPEIPLLQHLRASFPADNSQGSPLPVALSAHEYALFDFSQVLTGFVQCELEASERSDVYLVFDEMMIDDHMRRGADVGNVIKLELAEGVSLPFESFEPYTFRHLAIFTTKGKVDLKSMSIREYVSPEADNCSFTCDDEALNQIFAAARQTYRQNTLDVFMDCPSRERAGWLCDSYFTGQSAQFFSGNTTVERVMLDNFVQAKAFPHLPKGMLPMCYPADHSDGNHIPQWALWYIIELEGYLLRSGETDPSRFRPLIDGLLDYLKQFQNSDGLLESLPGWSFVEWSAANDYVQDVNYPTNMLYYGALKVLERVFDDGIAGNQASALRERIIAQSFDGEFFADNAMRNEDSSLSVTRNRTEVCQYYAFFFRVATPYERRFDKLHNTIINVFGPKRQEQHLLPEISQANAFIGNYLRMELFLRWGLYDQVLQEAKDYFHGMALKTGTLWEHAGHHASLNHGFASLIGITILRCLLGPQSIDIKNRKIILDASTIDLPASATIGTPFGEITLGRTVAEGGMARIEYSIPEEFQVTIRPSAVSFVKK